MNRFRGAIACLVAFAYLVFLLTNSVPVHAATATVSTDQPIYPIWGLGGQVKVTAENLLPNVTYFLWLQNPQQSASNFTSLSLVQAIGAPASTVLNISPRAPPGTYILTLSRSDVGDTREAVAHFGVFGTNLRAYQRTDNVMIMGGGFAPNSTIALAISSAGGVYAGFPVNVTTRLSGDFKYDFKLSPSAATGSITASVTGVTFDTRQNETAKSTFTVTSTNITVLAFKAPVPKVERTLPASASYRLTYPDGSPVTRVNATANVMLGNATLYKVPLTLVDSTSGVWNATWAPPPSAANATYRFQFNPSNFTDIYGNKGLGSVLDSKEFTVVPAILQPTVQAQPVLQRTQTQVVTISAAYPSGVSVANITQASMTVARSDGTKFNVSPSTNASQSVASFKVPVSAVLGNWTVNYRVQDPWNNSGSNSFIFQVQLATLTFDSQTPNATQRTTFLNLTNTISYPDKTILTSNVTLLVYGVNQTWSPTLKYNATNGAWRGSVYIVQNATLARYNITWSAGDPYGNARSANYSTFVIPAQFSFVVERNNTAAIPNSNLDLPVLVEYPNGTSLSNGFGNVTGAYQNTTGYVFTVPLDYNATNETWHMYFFVPVQSNATLSFNATDRFGNYAIAADAYNLKISPVPRTVTQNLIITAVVAALIPVALLVWAFATISTRRRKHKP